MEIIAQGIGILGMAINVLSFQQKKQRHLIVMQLFGALLFAIHYLLLGLAEGRILIGSIVNGIGVARAYVFSNKEKFGAYNTFWVWLFSGLFVVSYILAFTVFGMEKTAANFIIEFLPIIGMVAATIGFGMKSAKNVRATALINSPSWLIYNIIRRSIGGTLCEVFTLASVVIGIVRLDACKKES